MKIGAQSSQYVKFPQNNVKANSSSQAGRGSRSAESVSSAFAPEQSGMGVAVNGASSQSGITPPIGRFLDVYV